LNKRTVIRIILIVALILSGIFLYTIGKEHKVIIDNKDITVGDIVYNADNTYKIRVDDTEIGLIKKGKRKVVKVTGINHKIVLEEIKDELLTGGGEKYKKEFKLKTSENATINIPAMINNVNEWTIKIK